MASDPFVDALGRLAVSLAEQQPAEAVQLEAAVREVNRCREARGEKAVSLSWLAEHAMRAAGLTRAERRTILSVLRPGTLDEGGDEAQ